jgi:predicted branched-subunit amino acid permease
MEDNDGRDGGDARRRAVVRDGIGVGVATGAYGVSFGAISVAAGLSIAQTCALSLLMFTGASQFAFVGLVNGGGSALAGAATATLLGSRNALYGLRLSSLLGLRGARRAVGAQLVIDESTALAIREDDPALAAVGFWSAGLGVYVFWNLGTLVGAVAGAVLPDPKALGLDAAVPAAFLALLAPRMRGGEPWTVALVAAAVATVSVPFVPAGVPVLLAAAVAVLFGLAR